ncbi:MAG: hypothetical protein GXO44_01335 [Deferribacteres bacterium]|nr:hypothetical protein [Deferribacteres bacterium]
MGRRVLTPAVILLLVAALALVLGGAIGGFFTERTVAKVVASIPASPIVLDAQYNREKHSITYTIMNPGGLPLTIVEESFVFTPGKETKEKAYIVSHIPVHSVLAPGVATQVELKLKAGTEKLKLGDAVLATFTYVHPLSSDFYSVVHPFKMGVKEGKTAHKQGEEKKAAEEKSSGGK